MIGQINRHVGEGIVGDNNVVGKEHGNAEEQMVVDIAKIMERAVLDTFLPEKRSIKCYLIMEGREHKLITLRAVVI